MQYLYSDSAQRAVDHLAGLHIAGKPVKVCLVYDNTGNNNKATLQQPPKLQTQSTSLDEFDQGGVHMTPQSKALLMANLSRDSSYLPSTFLFFFLTFFFFSFLFFSS